MRLTAHDYSANGPEDGKKPLRAKGKRSGTKHRHFTLEELKPALKRKLWTNEGFKKVCEKFLKATRFSLNKAWNEMAHAHSNPLDKEARGRFIVAYEFDDGAGQPAI